MTNSDTILEGDAITGRGGSVNPFLLVPDAAGFIEFAVDVFGAIENTDARTPMPDGELIHAELRVGDSWILLADTLDGWPARPALLQTWLGDVDAVIERATSRGARVVTPPTPFYGSLTLARLRDPWQNLWWLYQPVPGQPDPRPAWEGGSDVVFRTLDEELRSEADRADGPPKRVTTPGE